MKIFKKSRKKAQTVSKAPELAPKPALLERPHFILPAPPCPVETIPAIQLPPVGVFIKKPRLNYNNICTFPDLQIAVKSRRPEITLGADIAVTENLKIDHDLKINFNGHSLVAEAGVQPLRVLDIRRGRVELVGEGRIFVLGSGAIAVRVFGAISSGLPNYTSLICDNSIHLYAPEGSGILVAGNLGVAYGVTIDFAGEIVARSGICLASAVRGRDLCIPEITVRSGAVIVADENAGDAIEAAGIASWQVEAANLSGMHGISLGSGQFAISGAEIMSTSSAIYSESTEADLSLTISGGAFVSERDFAIFGNSTSFSELIVEDGDFAGAAGLCNPELASIIEVHGGCFHNNLAELLHTRPADPEPTIVIEGFLEPIFTPEPESAPKPAPEQLIPEVTVDSIIEEPLPEPAFEPTPEEIELDNLRSALSDSLSELQDFRAEDYVFGFADFTAAIAAARGLLTDPSATLEAFRTASDRLLLALDNLEEYVEPTVPEITEDAYLTDPELDELFDVPSVTYHESRTFQSALIDTAPANLWSTGVASLDESAPLIHVDPADFSRFARLRRLPGFAAPHRLARGLRAGLTAGISAFKSATHA